jgi:hypothetical protein
LAFTWRAKSKCRRRQPLAAKRKTKKKPVGLNAKATKALAKGGTVDVTDMFLGHRHVPYIEYSRPVGILGAMCEPKPKSKPPYDVERRDKVQAELAHELNTGNPNWTYADLLVKELAHWQDRVDAREKASSGMGFYNMFFGDD